METGGQNKTFLHVDHETDSETSSSGGMWNMLYSQMLYPCGAQRALFFLLLFLSIPPRKAAERGRGSVRLKMDHMLSVCEALMKLVLTFYITHITFCFFAFFCLAFFISFLFNHIRSAEMIAK